MQSQLTGFNADEESREPFVSGEINTEIFESVARDLTGHTDHVLITATGDGVTVETAFRDSDNEILHQTATLPAPDWETYEVNTEDPYTAVVNADSGLYNAFAGESNPDTITVELAPCDAPRATWGAVQDHAFYDHNEHASAFDTLTVAGHASPALRNPACDQVDIGPLGLGNSISIHAGHEIRNWLNNRNTPSEASYVLVVASSGNEATNIDHLLTFTGITLDPLEHDNDHLLLSHSRSRRSNKSKDIGDAQVVEKNFPHDNIQKHLPEKHRDLNAHSMTWGMYNTTALYDIFKHVRKAELNSGRYTLKMDTEFPIEVDHNINPDDTQTEYATSVMSRIVPILPSK